MTVYYEWDVEQVSAVETADFEEGDVIDHFHQTSYADCVALAESEPDEGTRYLIVLVRDDDDRRAWAYMEDGKLPAHFCDANGEEHAKVPQRFAREVERAAGLK